MHTLVHETFHWAAGHIWWAMAIIVVLFIMVGRLLLRPVPADAQAPSDNAGKIAMAIAIIFIGWLMFGPASHHKPPKAAPAPQPTPTITHITHVTHVTAHSLLSGTAIVIICVVAIGAAVAFFVNRRGG